MEKLGGGEAGSCNGPLVLPEQAGADVPREYLYCAKCKSFVKAEEADFERVAIAAEADGFVREALPIVPPMVKAGRPRVNPSEITLNMFPMQPEYHARLRPGSGQAR